MKTNGAKYEPVPSAMCTHIIGTSNNDVSNNNYIRIILIFIYLLFRNLLYMLLLVIIRDNQSVLIQNG